MSGGFGMGFMGIIWVVIFIVIVWWGWSYLKGKGKEAGQPKDSADSALDILRQRYAKGEISKEEFEEKKRHLTH
jgi:putative membrane protein